MIRVVLALVCLHGALSDDALRRAFLPGIWDDLLPWQATGITAEHMDALVEKHTVSANQPGIACQVINGTLYVVSPVKHLMRTNTWFATELAVYVAGLRFVAPHLPDVEFVLSASDRPLERNDTDGGLRLPILRYCKTKESDDVRVPVYDFFYKTHKTYEEPNPHAAWATKEDIAWAEYTSYGRFYNKHMPSAWKKFRNATTHDATFNARDELLAWANDPKNAKTFREHNVTVHIDKKRARGDTMQEWGRNKYVVHVDGITCSTKLEKSLSTSSLVLREQSGFYTFYENLLRPFEHYVPWWKAYPDDLVDALQWAERNPGDAERIGTAGRAFFDAYLTGPSLRAYWVSLFGEYAKLQTFRVADRHKDVRVNADSFVDSLSNVYEEAWRGAHNVQPYSM